MDPLSITASIIAILQLCGTTANAFEALRDACKTLPGRLQALQEEVDDLAAVLEDVASCQQARSQLPPSHDHATHLPALLGRATRKLNELHRIISNLTTVISSSRIRLLQANAWRKIQGRLKVLQSELVDVKVNLNVLVGAANSRDMVTVRLKAETILNMTAENILRHEEMRNGIRLDMDSQRNSVSASMADLQSHFDKRLELVEQALQTQESRLYANQSIQLGSDAALATRERARPSADVHAREGTTRFENHTDVVGIRMTRQIGACRRNCPCACHKQRKASTPSAVDRWLGQMSFEFAGISMINAKCNNQSCERAQTPQASVEYWFPFGVLWSQIIRLRMGYEPNVGPQLQLSLLRRVPDSAPAINFAIQGNIEGLQGLFRNGLASPRDVSSTRGYTMLRWAMYAKQYETCRFLLHAGADPDYRPISPYDNSPRNKANDFILQGGLSKYAEEVYRQIAAGTDYIEEQDYTPLHKAVLGLTLRGLDEVISESAHAIETPDAMGRTPLSWAACRGNERDIILLLAHGANPNTVDAQLSGPVSNAADRGHTTCVRLLLEAGADPDPIRPGVLKGSPLNCASRNAHDPLLIKTLLDFGANIEACGTDGITSLVHVARRDKLSFAQILLEYGAKINATTSAQQTPLTTAITHNSHHLLRLLLARWREYSVCPRLRGPHMLSLVATFADVETMSILAATDHLKVSYDPNYKIGEYLQAVKSRYDASEKLLVAFKGLLEVMAFQQVVDPTDDASQSAESMRRTSTVFIQATPEAFMQDDQDSADCDEFEDALENLVDDGGSDCTEEGRC